MSDELINIAHHLPLLAKQQPQTLAVADQKSGQEYTYQQLDEISDLVAAGLKSLGVTKGTRVVLMVTPGLDFFALVFAIFKIGAVLVAVDPGIGIKNLKKCLGEAEPQVFIGNRKAHFARNLFNWSKESITTNIIVGADYTPAFFRVMLFGSTMQTLSTIKQQGRQQNDISDIANGNEMKVEDSAAILFTSGSTGVPKGVVYSHANFIAQVDALKNLYDIQPGEIDLSTFPLFALFAPALGMSSIVPDMDFTRPGKVNPKTIFNAIEKYHVTTMFGSPALLNRIGRYGEKNNKSLHGLKRVVSAGAPVAASVIKKITNMLEASAQVFTPYGATESLPVASIGSDVILNETSQQTNIGKGVCVGTPVESIDLKIIRLSDKPDEDVINEFNDDLVLDPNTIGEIIVKGPQVTQSYFHREQSTKLAKITDPAGGFYHRMGDTGYLDEQGRLWFCGRVAHRVITEEEKLFSIPCEGIFNTNPKVFRSALISLTVGHKIVSAICIELEDEFKNLQKENIAKEIFGLGNQFELTKNIEHLFFHPSFPVDIRHNAKIGREKLADWASTNLAKGIKKENLLKGEAS